MCGHVHVCVRACALHMCAYMCLCVCTCASSMCAHVCACTCICTYKADGGSFSVSPLYLETELLTWCSLILLDCLGSEPQHPPALLPQYCVTEHTTMPGFYTVVEDTSSSAHVCILLTEPSPQLCALRFSEQYLIICILQMRTVWT